MGAPRLQLRGAAVLIVDDTPANLKILRLALEPEGYEILVANSGEGALRIARKTLPDLILMDVMMPGLNGYEACARLKEDDTTRDIPVIFVTAKNDLEGIVEGFQAGGIDYIVKPFKNQEVLVRTRTHLERHLLGKALAEKNEELGRKNLELERKNGELLSEIDHRRRLSAERNHLVEQLSLVSAREAERWGIEGFIGRSPVLKKIVEDIARLQQSGNTSVLITGESGTGKELIARAIHFGSVRASAPFVPVNCSAIPGELAESSLFGHVKGAFTGADRDRDGYFGLADGGTLFLDEIADMPLELQAKLLRVVEDGVVTPVGAAEGKPVDVRILAATNARIEERIESGDFRQDLYFRLATFPVTAPPLRERKEDITALAEHFTILFGREMGLDPPGLSSEALEVLLDYDFPGNVRELKNIIERALIESGGADIQPEHVHLLHTTQPRIEERALVESDTPESGGPTVRLPMNLAEAEEVLIKHALEQADGNVSQAARVLGTNRPHVYRVIRRRDAAGE